jgi:16S rRNA C967 or C1407 C5-methylase (RsmB/RsmF family)
MIVQIGLISGEEGQQRIKVAGAQEFAKKVKTQAEKKAEKKKAKKKSAKKRKAEEKTSAEEDEIEEEIPEFVEKQWKIRNEQIRAKAKKPKTPKVPEHYATSAEVLKALAKFASREFIYVDPRKLLDPPKSIAARGLYEIQVISLFHYYWSQMGFIPCPHAWIVVQFNVSLDKHDETNLFLF